MSDSTKRRNRILFETPSGRHRGGGGPAGRRSMTGGREGIVALTVIGAAALATFIALFLTSRPYDPMNSTLAPNETVPAGSLVIAPSPSPKASPSTSPSPELNLAAGATPTPQPVEAVRGSDGARNPIPIEPTPNAGSGFFKHDR